MIQYIYFVKCPNCDDEPFDFFNDAKDYALGCLSAKPIITQIEVDRNDFGECTDSRDLGTVWSWEDMMTDVPVDDTAVSVFTKDDLSDYEADADPEFNVLDNSLDAVPDNFRKPIPDGMTVEDLVEEMEENEDDVECKWCGELFDKSEGRYEVDMGWLCDYCIAAIKSRGETLTFREGPLDESATTNFTWDKEPVELEYDKLSVTLQGEMKDSNDPYEPPYCDEWDEVVSHTYEADPVSVAEYIYDLMTEEDIVDVPGGFNALDTDDALFNRFMEEHFYDLVEKYMTQLLAKFEDDAARDYEDNYNPAEARRNAEANYWDDYRDGHYFDESCATEEKQTSMLEELEDSETYRERLTLCPECATTSFDIETGICINCGFN